MKFYFPDSQDLVDPSFDFESEKRSIERVRQRDDLYAHEVFEGPVSDGLLVSKGIVDGISGGSGKYTLAQRHRLLRVGARRFFRLEDGPRALMSVLGDCGAFTYVKEPTPPFTVDEVLDFYSQCGFDLGISVDHVILSYQPRWDVNPGEIPADVLDRQRLTLSLAAEFLERHRVRRLSFEPLGVAQGWSPKSYAFAVVELQKMGYRYIAVGGMVPLKTTEIVASLSAMAAVRERDVRFHLLGITRTDAFPQFEEFGVGSFDSTSPLRQAFKDDKNNYYAQGRTYAAVRVPQVEGNPGLQKRIRAGQVKQPHARELELRCMDLLKRFDRDEVGVDEVVSSLVAYERVHSPEKDYCALYRETLENRPWRDCPCEICRALGIHVVLFRGAERNRRRGFHNLWAFYRALNGRQQVTPPHCEAIVDDSSATLV